MKRIMIKEKKNFFFFSILVLFLGFLIANTLQIPLLADYANCGSGDCNCSCSGEYCSCWSGGGSCECICYDGDYMHCRSDWKFPEYPW